METFVIYQITNTINGKSYIGQSSNFEERWKKHLRDAARKIGKTSTSKKFAIHHAINKYGAENFSFQVIQECQSLEEANLAEMFHIQTLKTLAPLGYNLTTGGCQGSPSQETKEKIREKLKISSFFNRPDQEHPNCGRKLSENHKNKISESNSGDSSGVKKINSLMAKEIYLKALNNIATPQLMEEYQLSQNAILNILNKRSWKEILADLPTIDLTTRNLGANRFNAKLNEDQVREIIDLHRQGMKQTEICKIYQISATTCCNIIKKKRWKHLHYSAPS